MLKKNFLHRSLHPGVVVENSPLRRVDPRVKLAMGLCASLMVMLPLDRLAIFLTCYGFFLTWARLLPTAARQAWRMRWLILVLFILDFWLVNLELALAVTLRLTLLAGVFSLLVATTTLREFGLALENLRFPYRYAFSLSLAFQSLTLLDNEWRAIQEAQRSRGITFSIRGWRQFFHQAGTLVALTVPAIVLTTRRAWEITEAAYARGFDSPHRCAYHRLMLRPWDYLLLVASLLVTASFFWRL